MSIDWASYYECDDCDLQLWTEAEMQKHVETHEPQEDTDDPS